MAAPLVPGAPPPSELPPLAWLVFVADEVAVAVEVDQDLPWLDDGGHPGLAVWSLLSLVGLEVQVLEWDEVDTAVLVWAGGTSWWLGAVPVAVAVAVAVRGNGMIGGSDGGCIGGNAGGAGGCGVVGGVVGGGVVGGGLVGALFKKPPSAQAFKVWVLSAARRRPGGMVPNWIARQLLDQALFTAP